MRPFCRPLAPRRRFTALIDPRQCFRALALSDQDVRFQEAKSPPVLLCAMPLGKVQTVLGCRQGLIIVFTSKQAGRALVLRVERPAAATTGSEAQETNNSVHRISDLPMFQYPSPPSQTSTNITYP